MTRVFEGICLCVFKSFDDRKLPVFPQTFKRKTAFLSRKSANTRSTKALRDSAAFHESQPESTEKLKKLKKN